MVIKARDEQTVIKVADKVIVGETGVTNNSPTAGSISWSDFRVQREDTAYDVPAGNTDKRYTWWDYSAASAPKKALVKLEGGGWNIHTRLAERGWNVTTLQAADPIPSLADIQTGGYTLFAGDAGHHSLSVTLKARLAEAYAAGISVYSSGNDTTSLSPLFSSTTARGAGNNTAPIRPYGSHPVAQSWVGFTDTDLLLYLSGVNAAATVVGVADTGGTDRPYIVVMESEFAKWVHVQPYNHPALLSDTVSKWLSAFPALRYSNVLPTDLDENDIFLFLNDGGTGKFINDDRLAVEAFNRAQAAQSTADSKADLLSGQINMVQASANGKSKQYYSEGPPPSPTEVRRNRLLRPSPSKAAWLKHANVSNPVPVTGGSEYSITGQVAVGSSLVFLNDVASGAASGVAGDVFSARMKFKNTGTVNVGARIIIYGEGTDQSSNPSYVTVTPGQTVDLVSENFITTGSPTGVSPRLIFNTVADTNMKFVIYDGVVLEKSSTVGSCFDGDTSSNNNNIYGWVGTTGLSESIEYSTGGYNNNDTWYQFEPITQTLIGQWKYSGFGVWDKYQINSAWLSEVDAGKIKAGIGGFGYLNANVIAVQSLSKEQIAGNSSGKSLKDDIDQINDDTSDLNERVCKYEDAIVITPSEILMSSGGGDVSMSLTSTKLDFKESGSSVAELSGKKLKVRSAEIAVNIGDYLQFGSHIVTIGGTDNKVTIFRSTG